MLHMGYFALAFQIKMMDMAYNIMFTLDNWHQAIGLGQG